MSESEKNWAEEWDAAEIAKELAPWQHPSQRTRGEDGMSKKKNEEVETKILASDVKHLLASFVAVSEVVDEVRRIADRLTTAMDDLAERIERSPGGLGPMPASGLGLASPMPAGVGPHGGAMQGTSVGPSEPRPYTAPQGQVTDHRGPVGLALPDENTPGFAMNTHVFDATHQVNDIRPFASAHRQQGVRAYATQPGVYAQSPYQGPVHAGVHQGIPDVRNPFAQDAVTAPIAPVAETAPTAPPLDALPQRLATLHGRVIPSSGAPPQGPIVTANVVGSGEDIIRRGSDAAGMPPVQVQVLGTGEEIVARGPESSRMPPVQMQELGTGEEIIARGPGQI